MTKQELDYIQAFLDNYDWEYCCWNMEENDPYYLALLPKDLSALVVHSAFTESLACLNLPIVKCDNIDEGIYLLSKKPLDDEKWIQESEIVIRILYNRYLNTIHATQRGNKVCYRS